LRTKANDQELEHDATNYKFTGTTEVWVIDGVWKWAPNGNATRTNFKLQGEYLHTKRDGEFTTHIDNTTQSGWYLQGIYQFIPHWRAGLRTEHLDSGSLSQDHQARKHSVMLDYSPSEFSRVRLQLAKDYARGDAVDNQLVLQYQVSLGAHGAHSY
jgi:outer membrane receptor protein involved in Fe transport